MTRAPTTDSQRRGPIRLGWLLWGAFALISLGGGAAYWLATRPAVTISAFRPPLTNADDDAPGSPLFRDVTATSGLHFTYHNGEESNLFTLLEVVGGGIALFDYDGDGLLDVFVTGGGHFDGPSQDQIKGRPCKLFKNLGAWKFADVTSDVGLESVSWWYTHGAAVADYDCDGWPDLLVTGYGRLALFHNETDGNEGRRFVDVSERVGLHDESWSTSAGWADLDHDDFPDLYVCHYVDWSFQNNPICKGVAPGVERDTCSPARFKPLVHALFRNEQGQSFHNESAAHGFRAAGSGLGVLLADLNADGRPDIYVANDLNHNFLFYNRAGKLEEQGLLSGVAHGDTGLPDGSMGVDAADYDGSGRPSVWVTNFETQLHALYRNDGQERFHHASRAAGLTRLGRQWVSFGTGFLDFDNDGWEDLVIVSGHVWRYPATGPARQRPRLLRNEALERERVFRDVSSRGGEFFDTPTLGRGLAIGDLDNDGWPDLAVSHTNSPVVLLRNEAAAGLSSPHRWLGLKLVGRGHRDVAGSTVTLEDANGILTRFSKGGGSYLSASDPRLLFGLGETEHVKRVTVRWSWGQSQSWENLESNRYWELHEGEQIPR